ncbi:P-loop NTPase fold protein, partial [Marinobacter sp. 1Y8]
MTDYSVMKELTFSNRDEFTRKPIAEKIIKLLDSDIDVSPLIIDGKWGTGKTEFCFKLKNLIQAHNPNNYKVGYVNAFQADHANEPLLTLIAEVASFYDEKDEKRKNFVKNAVPYLRLISGIGLKAGLG